MLDEKAFYPEGPAVLVAFEIVSWRVEMLVERPLGSEGPVAILAFKIVSWGTQVLLESYMTAK